MSKEGPEFIAELSDIECGGIDPHMTGLHLGEIQYVVEYLEEPFCTTLDDLGKFSLLLT